MAVCWALPCPAGARVVAYGLWQRGNQCFLAGRGGQEQGLTGYLAACFSWCTELGLLHVLGSLWQSLGSSLVGRGTLHACF